MADRIAIPRNTLAVLIGPAGCGKSFFAAKHFQPTQVVSSDECRALISDDPSNQLVSGPAFELMRFIIGKRLQLGRLTIADATNLTRDSRRPLLKAASGFGFNAVAIIFEIPLATCLERNSARERVVPHQALREQHVLLEETLSDIVREGFSSIFVLDEFDQETAKVEIVRKVNRRPTQALR